MIAPRQPPRRSTTKIVDGLVVSQLITLDVTPVIYLWLEWFQENVLDRVPFLHSVYSHHNDEVKVLAPTTA